MAVERLVGLFVSDDGLYQQYRENMLPILEKFGGAFGYDFKVAEVLKSESSNPINRVFTIYFDTEASLDGFFSDQQYLEVKAKYFEPSVLATTVIAKYER